MKKPFLKLAREPLAHFLGAASLLFIASAVFSVDNREVITVDVPTQEFLIQQAEDLRLSALTEDQKQRVIDGYIEEEILVREARKRGLANSSRIRRLLIQNMRFFVASDLPQPTEADLKNWFDANHERFESPPAISYDHVFFKDPESVPADTLHRLLAGEDHTAIGETNPLNLRLPRMTQRNVAEAFGPSAAPNVLAISDAQWHGPFISPNGAHFLRITQRHPSSVPEFEASRSWLEQDWMMNKQRELIDGELEQWRKNYQIKILTSDSSGQ